MAGSGNQIKALLRSHAERDDASFYAVASQIAASAARQGHSRLASDLKGAINEARVAGPPRLVAMPRQEPGSDSLAEVAVESRPRIHLKDLVLPEGLLAQIQEVVTEQRQRHALLAHGFDPAHRLLLEGPPGTGKTFTASVLASELDLPLFTVRLDALLTRFLGETSSKLRTVFDAMDRRRGVYLFDEFDALGGDRSGNDIGEARRILNTFLVMLEEVGSESVVVASTNHPGSLDRALFRRFDTMLRYDLPGEPERRQILRAHLRGTAPKGIRWAPLTQRTEGLSHAEIGAASERAAKRAILRGDPHVTQIDLEIAIDERQSSKRG